MRSRVGAKKVGLPSPLIMFKIHHPIWTPLSASMTCAWAARTGVHLLPSHPRAVLARRERYAPSALPYKAHQTARRSQSQAETSLPRGS